MTDKISIVEKIARLLEKWNGIKIERCEWGPMIFLACVKKDDLKNFDGEKVVIGVEQLMGFYNDVFRVKED